MIIAFDAEPLIKDQKTGIGFCEAGFVKNIVHLYPENHYLLYFFCFKNEKEKSARLAHFVSENVSLGKCTWFPSSLYRLLWNFFPIPYHWFFGKKANLTHFFNYHIPPGVYGKRICTVHDMAYKAFPETVRLRTKIMLNLSLRASCRRADHIITISEFSKQEIIKYLGLPKDKITVIPIGVDLSFFRPIEDPEQILPVRKKYGIPERYFLYLGTLEPRKNIVRLIQAFAKLAKKLSNLPVLVLAGRKGWMYDSIFQTVSELHLNDKIIFTGYIEDWEAPLLLNGAEAFLFPSLYEGFGMPPLEAMACGTPVLTSNCSSLPEVVGEAAILVDPYSIDEIAAGMERLATDPKLRRELAKKGLEQAKKFSWEHAASLLMDVYQSLMKE